MLGHSVVLNSATPCSPPGSSVHGILQVRILEWVAIPSSRGSSQPRDRTQVSCTVGGFFTIWATREVQLSVCVLCISARYTLCYTFRYNYLKLKFLEIREQVPKCVGSFFNVSSRRISIIKSVSQDG